MKYEYVIPNGSYVITKVSGFSMIGFGRAKRTVSTEWRLWRVNKTAHGAKPLLILDREYYDGEWDSSYEKSLCYSEVEAVLENQDAAISTYEKLVFLDRASRHIDMKITELKKRTLEQDFVENSVDLETSLLMIQVMLCKTQETQDGFLSSVEEKFIQDIQPALNRYLVSAKLLDL